MNKSFLFILFEAKINTNTRSGSNKLKRFFPVLFISQTKWSKEKREKEPRENLSISASEISAQNNKDVVTER